MKALPPMPRALDKADLAALRASDLPRDLVERIAAISAFLDELDQAALHLPLREPEA